jgi:hypothetical protein
MKPEHTAAVSSKPYLKIAGCYLLLTAAGCGAEPANTMKAASMAPAATSAPSSAAAGSRAAPTSAQAGQSAMAPTTTTTTTAPKVMDTGANMPPAMKPSTTTTTTANAGSGGASASPSAAGSSAPAAEGGSETGGHCLDVVTDYASKGPFEFELKTEGQVFMWVPKVPAGCKIPVTHLANGTGAGCMNYEEINSYLASHGFLASCYDNPNTGAGDQGIMALEKVFELYPDLADKKIGSTGHSQGGQASFIVLQKAEVKFGSDFTYAGLAMEPASGFGAQPSGGTWASLYGMIKSPMFMFSGTADALVAAGWVGSAYNAMGDIEAYWWSAIGATHVPTPDAHTQQVAIPWFRWKLLGDKKACEAFKALPDGDQWDAVQSKNEAPCE